MKFGDILDEWDASEKERRAKGKDFAQAKSAGKAPGTGAGAGQAGATMPATPKKQSAREAMLAYMNRHGVEGKGAEADDYGSDRDREREERAELEALRPEAVMDLHGKLAEDAEAALRAFLDISARRGLKKVLIIHGKGLHSESEPVLGALVKRVLERHPRAGKHGHARREQGGKGATWVILKQAGD